MKTALWWIRRDLRLADNPALSAALAHAERVVPVFVLDPAQEDTPEASQKRRAFLLDGLRQLDADLQARGSRLTLRRGDPADILAALSDEVHAEAIFAQEDFAPAAQARDARVAERRPLRRTAGLVVQPPGTVLKADGTPYVVYTPFSHKWKAQTGPLADTLIPAPEHLLPPPDIESAPLPTEPALPAAAPFAPGEAEALRRLHEFCTGTEKSSAPIYRYEQTRDRMDLDGTSRLSPYLRFGMLSARQAVVAARAAITSAPDPNARQGAETWLNELIWREFYVHILHFFPHVRGQSFRSQLRQIDWLNDETAFAAWRAGHTGYPVVDAAMRQLAHSGWMHNRARMVVASFLVKDLLIDWRWGERWFMQHLVDGDPAANNGGWQWTAGTGTDAAPYFRIFNPLSQSQKHDPDGVYIRRWVPELQDVPQKFIHEPWRMPEEVQRDCGCIIGKDYPAPIVDHSRARKRTLAAYRAAKEKAQTRETR